MLAHRGPDGKLYLNVQSNLLDVMATRVVIPLVPQSEVGSVAKYLNPIIDIGEEPHALMTHLMAAVPVRALSSDGIDLSDRHDEIVKALDRLFFGY